MGDFIIYTRQELERMFDVNGGFYLHETKPKVIAAYCALVQECEELKENVDRLRRELAHEKARTMPVSEALTLSRIELKLNAIADAVCRSED